MFCGTEPSLGRFIIVVNGNVSAPVNAWEIKQVLGGRWRKGYTKSRKKETFCLLGYYFDQNYSKRLKNIYWEHVSLFCHIVRHTGFSSLKKKNPLTTRPHVANVQAKNGGSADKRLTERP